MSDGSAQGVFARRALAGAVLAVAAWATQCDYTDYPLEPTFCDDWCRVLLRSNCDQEPENCVRTCERSIAPAPCFELQEELLSCYRATPESEFVCSGQGFQQSARPEEWICPAERDALIDCAYPEVKLCLDVCRAVEASQASDAGADASTSADPSCPSHDIPCDSICWVARRYLTQPSDGGDGTDASDPADAASLGALAPAVIECALERAEACRATTDADAGDENWASVLSECAEELGL
jgi:hypothetical protein